MTIDDDHPLARRSSRKSKIETEKPQKYAKANLEQGSEGRFRLDWHRTLRPTGDWFEALILKAIVTRR
ncbi:MAG: hypothetical protein ACKOAU_09935, partial [Pirellula sp.]